MYLIFYKEKLDLNANFAIVHVLYPNTVIWFYYIHLLPMHLDQSCPRSHNLYDVQLSSLSNVVNNHSLKFR